MKISEFAIKHPVIITICLIAAIFFGIISFSGLKQDMFAQVEVPTVMVLTVYPGVGPQDIEREITNYLEDELSTISGLTSVESVSANSLSIITLKFDWDINLDMKLPDIREKINNVVDELPAGIEGTPEIFKMSANSLPAISLVCKSDLDRETLTDFVEKQVISQLSRINGVAKIDMRGGVKKNVEIKLRTDLIESKGISIIDVFQVLQYSNISFPAGSITYKGNEINLRTYGEFSTLSEIENLVVGYKDESFIRLKDIAGVSIAEAKTDAFTMSRGKTIVVLDILKQSDKDTILVVREIKKALRDIENKYNNLITFQPIYDQASDIKLSINSVKNSAIMGGILAIVILFVFLRDIRTTLIIGTSIPLSILFTFIGMKINRQSINLMSLGGLTVGIGMMVDSSIVVLENIHKIFQKNPDAKLASAEGAQEVSGAVLASILTSLAVFIPLVGLKGFAGVALKDVAYVIIFSLTASLIVAIIIVPFLTSIFLKKESEIHKLNIFKKFSNLIQKGLDALVKFYQFLLQVTLNNRVFIYFLAIAVLIISVFVFSFLGFEFVPEADVNEIQMKIETPIGYSLEKTARKLEDIESLMDKLVPEIDKTSFYVGMSDSFGINKAPNQIFGRVRLVKNSERKRSVFEIIDLLQVAIKENIPDVSFTIKNGGVGALAALVTGGQGFMIEVFGNNFDEVYQAAKSVDEIMQQDPNIYKTEMNTSYNRMEMISDLSLDDMGNLGITPYEAAITSRILFNGIETGKFRTSKKNYDIFLTSDIANSTINDDILNKIVIKSQTGKFVSFANFSTISTEPALSVINHKNKLKSIIITGYMKKNDFRKTQDRIVPRINQLAFPVGINYEITGQAKEIQETFSSLFYVLMIAIFLVYMVMVIQFEKFSHPLIVMGAIPFTFIGVVLGLLVFHSTLSIVSFMGLITLAGVVVNNAIVMIDYINLLRTKYRMELLEAVVKGGSSRLMPILMTTLTTVLGVIPMAFGMGEGAEIYAPLAQAVAGGLITSTLITLFLVPSLYYTMESRKGKKTVQDGVLTLGIGNLNKIYKNKKIKNKKQI